MTWEGSYLDLHALPHSHVPSASLSLLSHSARVFLSLSMSLSVCLGICLSFSGSIPVSFCYLSLSLSDFLCLYVPPSATPCMCWYPSGTIDTHPRCCH